MTMQGAPAPTGPPTHHVITPIKIPTASTRITTSSAPIPISANGTIRVYNTDSWGIRRTPRDGFGLSFSDIRV